MSNYYKTWPSSSCGYNKDLNWSCSIAIQYLTKIAPKYKNSGRIGIVVMDLDDTIFFSDDEKEDEITIKEMCIGEDIFILPINRQVVKVAEVAEKLGFKILYLTARPSESRMASIVNLNMFNVPKGTVVVNDRDQDPWNKIKIRQELAAKPNHDIVATFGDKWTDVYMPGPNTMIVKLPEGDSRVAYIYIPS